MLSGSRISFGLWSYVEYNIDAGDGGCPGLLPDSIKSNLSVGLIFNCLI